MVVDGHDKRCHMVWTIRRGRIHDITYFSDNSLQPHKETYIRVPLMHDWIERTYITTLFFFSCWSVGQLKYGLLELLICITSHCVCIFEFNTSFESEWLFLDIFTGAFHIRLTITGQNNVGEQKDFNNKVFAVKQEKTQAKINLFQAWQIYFGWLETKTKFPLQPFRLPPTISPKASDSHAIRKIAIIYPREGVMFARDDELSLYNVYQLDRACRAGKAGWQ